jgi:hypothetical protein
MLGGVLAAAALAWAVLARRRHGAEAQPQRRRG